MISCPRAAEEERAGASTPVVKSLNRLERRFGNKFRKVFKTITVDNGSEFSDFVGLEKSIYKGRRTSVYYCHPYTSCERGSNERLNREIRRIFPKGTDFTKVSEERVKACEDWVNAYPREIFGYCERTIPFGRSAKAALEVPNSCGIVWLHERKRREICE